MGDPYAPPAGVVATQTFLPPPTPASHRHAAGPTKASPPPAWHAAASFAALALSLLGVLAATIGMAMGPTPPEGTDIPFMKLLGMVAIPFALMVGLQGAAAVAAGAVGAARARRAPAVLLAGAAAVAATSTAFYGTFLAEGGKVMRALGEEVTKSVGEDVLSDPLLKKILMGDLVGSKAGYAGSLLSSVGGFVAYAAMLALIIMWGGWGRPLTAWMGGRGGRGAPAGALSSSSSSRVAVAGAGLGLVAVGVALKMAAGLLTAVGMGSASDIAEVIASLLMTHLPALALGGATLARGGRRGRLASLGALAMVLSSAPILPTWSDRVGALEFFGALFATVGAAIAAVGMGVVPASECAGDGAAPPALVGGERAAAFAGLALTGVGLVFAFAGLILLPGLWTFLMPWAIILAALIYAAITAARADGRHRLPAAAILVGTGSTAVLLTAVYVAALWGMNALLREIVGEEYNGILPAALAVRAAVPLAGWLATFVGSAIAGWALASAPSDEASAMAGQWEGVGQAQASLKGAAVAV